MAVVDLPSRPAWHPPPVLLIEPSATPYDVRFRLGPVPVRIHWMFWLMAFLLGRPFDSTPVQMLLWMGVCLVSILVHELGHVGGYAMFGLPSRVVLYSMGGLAISDYGGHLAPRARILVSLAGPAAGLAFGAVVVGLSLAAGGLLLWTRPDSLGISWPAVLFENRNLTLLVYNLLYINLAWSLVNLLPVFPLDGGQVAREAISLVRPHDGLQVSLIVSIVTGVAVALLAATRFNDLYVVILFALLAYNSYHLLRQVRQFESGW